MTEPGDALKRYNLRAAEWLGLDPSQVFRLDVDDSRAEGSPMEPPEITVWWEATKRQGPSRGRQGVVIASSSSGGPVTYSAEIEVTFPESREFVAEVGKKPRRP